MAVQEYRYSRMDVFKLILHQFVGFIRLRGLLVLVCCFMFPITFRIRTSFLAGSIAKRSSADATSPNCAVFLGVSHG